LRDGEDTVRDRFTCVSWRIYIIHERLTGVIWRLGEVTDDVPDDVDAHWTASGIALIHMMNQPERSAQCQEQAE
jgi:hypothetical protein